MTPLIASIVGIGLIFIATLTGAMSVIFVKDEMSRRLKTIVIGFGAGIMLSAAIFGLLEEAVANSADNYKGAMIALPLGIGFALGVIVLFGFDEAVTKIRSLKIKTKSEGGLKILFAIALHNIPEGLSVGFVFGAAFVSDSSQAIWGALGISIALAIHNLLQGITASLTMYELGTSKKNSFWYMAVTAVIETVFAIVGLFLANSLASLMPWLLAFAGGAMIYVVIDELIPDAMEQEGMHTYAVLSFLFGFVLMMLFELVF